MIKQIRIFGFIWTVIFAAIAVFPIFFGNEARLWAVGAAAFFGAVSLIVPRILTIPYKLWIKLGETISLLISNVVIFLMFYLLFVPIGLIAKLFSRDFLDKKIDAKAETYWEKRKINPGSMNNQF